MARRPKPRPLNVSYEAWVGAMGNRQYARQLAGDPQFQQLVVVLAAMRPTGFLSPGNPVADAALELGRREGYDDCLRNLEVLLNPPEPTPTDSVEADYSEAYGRHS